jgi:hypothetical protein
MKAWLRPAPDSVGGPFGPPALSKPLPLLVFSDGGASFGAASLSTVRLPTPIVLAILAASAPWLLGFEGRNTASRLMAGAAKWSAGGSFDAPKPARGA